MTKNRIQTIEKSKNRMGVSAVIIGLIILVSAGIFLSLIYTSWLRDIVESYNSYQHLRIFRANITEYTRIQISTQYSSYGYYIPILINYSQGTEDLIDYALSFELTKAHVFQNSDGSDIWFANDIKSPFTYIPHWIEFWDSANNKARIWIKITIKAGQEMTIYMHYGAPPPSDLPQWQPEDLFAFYEDFSGSSVDETNWYIPDKYRDVNKYEVVDGEIRMYLGEWKNVNGSEPKFFWMDTQNPIDTSIGVVGKIVIENLRNKIFAGVELVLDHTEPFNIKQQNPHKKAILAKIQFRVRGQDKKHEFSKLLIYQDQSSHNNPESQVITTDLSDVTSIIFEVRYGLSWISIWDNLTDSLNYSPLTLEIPSKYRLYNYFLRIGAGFEVTDDESYVAYDYIFYRFIVDYEPEVYVGECKEYLIPIDNEEEVTVGWRIGFKLRNQGERDFILYDIMIDGKPFTKYPQIANITAVYMDSGEVCMIYDSITQTNVLHEDGFKIPVESTIWIKVFIVPGGKFQSGRSIEFTFISFKGDYVKKTVILP